MEENNKERFRDGFKDPRYFKIAFYSASVLCFCILFYFLLRNFDQFTALLGKLISIVSPFLAGLILAYFLNPIVKAIEKMLSKGTDRPKLVRFLSIILSLVVLALLIWAIVAVIFPVLVTSLKDIVVIVMKFAVDAGNWIVKFIGESGYSFLTQDQIQSIDKMIQDNISNIKDIITSVFFVGQGFVQQVIEFASSFTRIILNITVGLIVAIYVLIGKEKFSVQIKKVLFAFLSEPHAKSVLDFANVTNKVFNKFIIGQLIDAFIVGVLCFICLSIFQIPYAILISVLVAITNIIPYFGPFIGSIPSALILLTISFKDALIFVIIILILQQIDGNIINPRIVGESTGLSGLWVIFAVTVGGALFGIPGMFLGVPVFAVFYSYFTIITRNRLAKKNLSSDTLAIIEKAQAEI